MIRLVLIFCCLTTACSKNSARREIFIREAGWKFNVPVNFFFNDSAFNKDGSLIHPIPDDYSSLRLFVSKSDKGFVGASIWKDSLSPKAWKARYDKDTEWYFNEFRQVSKFQVLVTKYSNEKVGNVDFLVQHVKFIRKNTQDTFYLYHYFGQLKDKGIDFSFEYSDEEVGKSFHEILNSSEFSD